MNPKSITWKRRVVISLSVLGLAGVGAICGGTALKAQAPAPASAGAKLDIADGSSASYRVQEQLAGVNFPNDAVGMTSAVTGSVVLGPDGSVNSSQSKLTIDLRTLKSDQEMRDGYLQKRTLETDKFPNAEFVPKKITGIPVPLPAMGQTGFQMTGDLTIHGMTSEVTWTGIATFSKTGAAGRATTNFTFATFGLTKPTLARLLSVDDKIALEVAFKFNKS
jgi:polyisoprenoid-binding protein YceI